MKYELPNEVRVESDGPVRIVRLCRPEQLNAVNQHLHLGLTRVFPQLSADADAREAHSYLERARAGFAAKLAGIERPDWRRSYGEEIALHRAIRAATEAAATASFTDSNSP